MKRISLIILVFGIIIAGGIGYYMFNKPHTDVLKTTPYFKGTTAELAQQLSNADSASLNLYVEQVIEVAGSIQSIGATITLSNNINCELDSSQAAMNYQVGQEVTIKGIFSGIEGGGEDDIFSDMLGEAEPLIRLKGCFVLEN